MSKRSTITILLLSIFTTFGVAIIGFITRNELFSNGFPFKFTSFNFFGSETNYFMIILNIIFWYAVIWLVSKVIQNRL